MLIIHRDDKNTGPQRKPGLSNVTESRVILAQDHRQSTELDGHPR